MMKSMYLFAICNGVKARGDSSYLHRACRKSFGEVRTRELVAALDTDAAPSGLANTWSRRSYAIERGRLEDGFHVSSWATFAATPPTSLPGAKAPRGATFTMEDHMNDLTQTAIDLTPRRGFLGRVASAMGIGLAGIAGLAPTSLHAQAGRAQSDGPNWPGTLKGRHRQIVDAYEANSGFPLAFAYTFLVPNDSATAASC